MRTGKQTKRVPPVEGAWLGLQGRVTERGIRVIKKVGWKEPEKKTR